MKKVKRKSVTVANLIMFFGTLPVFDTVRMFYRLQYRCVCVIVFMTVELLL